MCNFFRGCDVFSIASQPPPVGGPATPAGPSACPGFEVGGQTAAAGDTASDATIWAAMLVAPASRRRWWCADAGWFYRPRIRPLSRSLSRTLPSTPAFWSAVTRWRPSDPASRHRRGRVWVDWEGCDHADGAPAACLVAGAADRIALPVGARHGPCAGRDTPPRRSSGTKPCPAPRWGAVFLVP